MRNISALTLFAIVLLATSLDAFRLPYYARDDPYLQQILTPRNGAKGPNQYQIYMAREYLDEMEQYEDPHDTVEEFLEPHFLWESKFIFGNVKKIDSTLLGDQQRSWLLLVFFFINSLMTLVVRNRPSRSLFLSFFDKN